MPGAGAFQIACATHLTEYRKKVKGKAQYGVAAFAEALLIIPKTLAANSGHDVQDSCKSPEFTDYAWDLANRPLKWPLYRMNK